MVRGSELILLKFHAIGALGHKGNIKIILDKLDKKLSEDDMVEQAQADAEHIKMVVYGYFPDITIDKFEEIVLKRLTIKQIVKELERRTK